MIGTVILAGQFNGAREFTKAGKSLKNSFWVTAIIGALLALILYFGAYIIYYFMGMPQDVLSAGIRYVQLRAIGVFLTFIYFSFAGFLRGIKDTKTPMIIFIAGSIAFVIFDYLFIFGAGPIEPMGSDRISIGSHYSIWHYGAFGRRLRTILKRNAHLCYRSFYVA